MSNPMLNQIFNQIINQIIHQLIDEIVNQTVNQTINLGKSSYFTHLNLAAIISGIMSPTFTNIFQGL